MNAVRTYQARRLPEQAEASGRFDGLLFFHGMRRDGAALAALAPRLAHDGDRVVHGLFTGAPADRLLEWAAASSDPWVFRAVAKRLLSEGAIQATFDLMETGIRQAGNDVSTLNLIIRHLAHLGETDTAKKLISISLGMAPQQADLERLGATLDQGLRPSAPRLNPVPPLASLAFYFPVYNVERFIRRAIEGVLSMNYPLEAVYVVDDGTPDNSIAIAREYPVTVLTHEENRGLAAARNTAFQHAEAAYLGAIDTDAYPEPDFAKAAMMVLEDAPPKVVGVGGRLVELHTDTPADLWRALHLSQDPGHGRIYDPRFLFGADTVYHRETVLAVGGYDERFRTNSEDGDIARKLKAEGHTFVVTPNAVARHMRRDTIDSALRTLWNWAFAHREEAGWLRDFDAVLAEMPTTLQQSINMINEDMPAPDQRPALYIDFLYVFHCTSQNLAHGVAAGTIAPGQARYVQEALLASLATLDGRHGGCLARHIRGDVGGMLPEAEPEPLAGDRAGVLAHFIGELTKVYDALTPEMYRAMEDIHR